MRRFAGILLSVGLLAGCGSDNAVAPSGPRLVILLEAAQISATKGSHLSIAAEVTRINGTATPVAITVSAATGVTASVASVSTTGTTTTAQLSIVVGSTTLPGQYPIVIHAHAEGFADVSAQLVVDLN
jgi:hypothetical protein